MQFINYILNWIYPEVCGFCNNINKDGLCKKCEIKLQKMAECKIDYYPDKEMYFTKHMYMFKYSGLIREKLIQYKFNRKSYMYRSFAKIMLKNEKMVGFLKSYDIIIPVPMYVKRKNKRGYNQCELIAKEITKNIDGLECYTNVLYKIKNTEAQSTLDKAQRKINLKNVYNIKNKEKIKDKKILILDDIYTTGNTLRECAKVLSNSEAQKIDVITIAKD